MSIQHDQLYMLPWSRTDNPGGWVEVTDTCDLECPGCYRSSLTGHVPVEEIKADILKLQQLVNCDSIGIAGGEPLLYPDLLEVVEFITRHDMKSRLLTNGETLTRNLAQDLKRAGLTHISFHIDSYQMRPGWEGKTEAETNVLRQQYADLIWEVGGIHCGFLITVYRSTLEQVPDILAWCRQNIQKVQHLAFIALRGFHRSDEIEYFANGVRIDLSDLRSSYTDNDEISISTEDIYDVIEQQFQDSHPCAYLSGVAVPETYKVLITSILGTKNTILGTIGARTAEFSQIMHHLLTGRYHMGFKKVVIGKKVFLLSLVDRKIRRCFSKYLKTVIRNPMRLFNRIYMQTIHLQQPKEIINGEINTCDGCLNQMLYQNRLIQSCMLDEYRLFGGPLIPVQSSESL